MSTLGTKMLPFGELMTRDFSGFVSVAVVATTNPHHIHLNQVCDLTYQTDQFPFCNVIAKLRRGEVIKIWYYGMRNYKK